MDKSQILERMQALDCTTPWAHAYDLGHGIHTIDPSNEQFVKKAQGLAKLAELLQDVVPHFSRRQTLKGMTVLDLACGEGAHSMALARQGAKVVGVDGRQLYVDRARFVSEVLAQRDVHFELGDVRNLDESKIGKFELVLCSGILHHLGQADFDAMIRSMARLCADLLFIYTHISTPLSVERHRLQGPVKSERGYEGYLFREHREGASAEEKYRQVRASLDNEHSFWATEESLYAALRSAGFRTIARLIHPHIFGTLEGSYRPLIIARV
jgi:2-polyprenyl-3-methyl-5-hydroxy-6-metoxy-1,4-benzoquinol methylase